MLRERSRSPLAVKYRLPSGLQFFARALGACEFVWIVPVMLVNSVKAVDRTIGVLAKALFVGAILVIAVVSAVTTLRKLLRQLCR